MKGYKTCCKKKCKELLDQLSKREYSIDELEILWANFHEN